MDKLILHLMQNMGLSPEAATKLATQMYAPALASPEPQPSGGQRVQGMPGGMGGGAVTPQKQQNPYVIQGPDGRPQFIPSQEAFNAWQASGGVPASAAPSTSGVDPFAPMYDPTRVYEYAHAHRRNR